ncbi:acyltransferase family protein [Spirosoma agri]|uniref:Acyltransferase n=1 Tax=Spirosoma agri TaxID=1987381 RepID=A0A6M0ISP4_9BACT|nr:acyltransferase [Spirosoma agri]NEU70675.1 acyltransferase [Spirosoma agri]
MNVGRTDLSFRQNNFDLIRIGAATQVLLVHSLRHLQLDFPGWNSLLSYFPGVPVFFGISGYLISASLERSPTWQHYCRNRLLRIFPGLWGLLLTTGLVLWWLHPAQLFTFEGGLWFISQGFGLIYTPAFLADFGFGSYNGSIWTIPIELQFYTLLPIGYQLISKTNHKRGNWQLVGWWLFFVVFAMGKALYRPGATIFNESTFEKLLRYTFMPHIYLFLTGVVAQRWKLHRWQWIRGKGLYWLAFTSLFWTVWGTTTLGPIVQSILLVLSSISLAYTVPTLADRLLKGNDISYGVYMYHGLLLNVLVTMNLLHQGAYLWVVFVGSYVAGYLSWRLVEKPFLRWKSVNRSAQRANSAMLYEQTPPGR